MCLYLQRGRGKKKTKDNEEHESFFEYPRNHSSFKTMTPLKYQSIFFAN